MIYFIRSPGGRIKIGTTIRLSERLKQLAAEFGHGLEILAVADGTYPVERQLHRRFASLKAFGEWFEPGEDLLGFIVAEGRPWDGSDEVPAGVAVVPQSEVPRDGKTLRIRLTHKERSILDAAAALSGKPTSAWVRDLALIEASRSLRRSIRRSRNGS